MASPRLENGYTPIPNALLEAIMRYHCSGGQTCILLAVVRATYGYHHPERQMSVSYIATMLKRHKRKVATDVTALIKKKVLLVISPETNRRGRVISLNTDYHQWEAKKTPRVYRKLEGVERLPVSEHTYSRVSENAYSGVSEHTNPGMSENAHS